jgi:FKBP-type peptidyl-prolyl cis-trans isomerase
MVATIALPVMAQNKQKPDKTKLKTESDSISYAIGVLMGESFKQSELASVNSTIFANTMNRVLTGDSVLMTREQAQTKFQTYMLKKIEAKKAQNLADGQKFLAENSKKEGVVTTASGLQYKVIKEGTGESPKSTDVVKVHYKGTLISGKVFDSSIDRGEPIDLAVNRVIPGWTEALQLMKPGAKWMLYIPANLAYGENPMQGGPIGPNEALIFEVELISIVSGNNQSQEEAPVIEEYQNEQ